MRSFSNLQDIANSFVAYSYSFESGKMRTVIDNVDFRLHLEMNFIENQYSKEHIQKK